MTGAKATAEILDPYEVDLLPWPLKNVLEGKPTASYCVIGRTDDRRNYSGVWECTPGRFEVNYQWDETIYVLKGRVTIAEEDGSVKEIKAGAVVHFPNGLRCVWTVHETIRKTYTLFLPEPQDL